ncbi:hypothetical protein [Pseudoxanthobacter sp.]|uniref:hypothetical protein n=1 Tax=Pseudoxanthobacter sp. TaxID=1925742 RepID=UPI002FE3BFA6
MRRLTLSRSLVSRAVLGISLAAAAAVAATPASAWVAYRGGFGGGWHGPAGGGAAWHGPTVAAGGWGYHPPAPAWGYHPPAWNPGAAAAVGAGVGLATGVAIGAAAAAPRPYPVPVAPMPVVGATYGVLPGGCSWASAYGYYSCGNVWYRPYYGPSGLVYTVVPAP